MKKKLFVLSGLILGLAPVVALAQTATGNLTSCRDQATGTIGSILCTLSRLLNIVIPILVTLAVIYFIWGVISYVIAGDEEAKKKGRDRIIFGVIGLAVIVGVWGLVKILTRTFDVNTGSENITFPTVAP